MNKSFYSVIVASALVLAACGGEQAPAPVPVPVPAPVPVPGPAPITPVNGNCSYIFATDMNNFLAQMQGCYGNIVISANITVHDLGGRVADVVIPAGQFAWADIYARVLPIMNVAFDGAYIVTPDQRVDFTARPGSSFTLFSQVLMYFGFNGWNYNSNWTSYPYYNTYSPYYAPHYHGGKKGWNISVGLGANINF